MTLITRRSRKRAPLDYRTIPRCRHPGCKVKVPLPPGSPADPNQADVACPEHARLPRPAKA